MTIDEAIGWLQGQVCPIDGLHTQQFQDFDSTWLMWEQCSVGHQWPLKHENREWVPDPDAVEEKLEEYAPLRKERLAMIEQKPTMGIEVQIPNTNAFLDELRAGRGPNVDNVIRVARTSKPPYLESNGRKIPSPAWDVYAEATYLRLANGVCLVVHLREFVGQEWITSDGPIMDERHQQVKERVQRSLSAIEDFCRGHNSDWIVVDGSQYTVVSKP